MKSRKSISIGLIAFMILSLAIGGCQKPQNPANPTTSSDPQNASTETNTESETNGTGGDEQTIPSSIADKEEFIRNFVSQTDYTPSDGKSYDAADLTDAVTILKQRMVARDHNFSIVVPSEQELTHEEVEDLVKKTMVHTGVPNEGDYIRNHFAYTRHTQSYENGATTIVFELGMKSTAEQERLVDAEVAYFMKNYPLDNRNLADKILSIYDYACDSITYDYARKNNAHTELYYGEEFDPLIWTQHTAYGAFVEHAAVCEGYALLFYRLALEHGIDARVIEGDAGEEGDKEAHAWNIVNIDDTYYFMDATWDATHGEHDFGFCMAGSNNFEFHDLTDPTLKDYEVSTEDYKRPQFIKLASDGFEYYRSYGAKITMFPGMTQKIPAYLDGMPVVGIQNYVFKPHAGKTVYIPEGVYAINSVSLEDINVFANVYFPSTWIWKRFTFFPITEGSICVTVPDNNPTVKCINNDLYSKDGKVFVHGGNLEQSSECIVAEGTEMIAPDVFSRSDKIEKVVFPDSIKTIDSFAFFECKNLKEVIIPESVTVIGQWAFGKTAIEKIVLPHGLEYFGGAVFSGCKNLASIEFTGGATANDSGTLFLSDGVLYNDMYLDNTIWTISYPHATADKDIVLRSDTIGINGGTFFGSKMESISLNEGLKYIIADAFWYCPELRELTIPASVEVVEGMAISYCNSLKDITILSKTATIESHAFGNAAEGYNPNKITYHGYTGSTLEAYCRDYGYTFVPLD